MFFPTPRCVDRGIRQSPAASRGRSHPPGIRAGLHVHAREFDARIVRVMIKSHRMAKQARSEPPTALPATILVHGIRTFGSWQERLRQRLEIDRNHDVVIFRYGYLDVLAFIFFPSFAA